MQFYFRNLKQKHSEILPISDYLFGSLDGTYHILASIVQCSVKQFPNLIHCHQSQQFQKHILSLLQSHTDETQFDKKSRVCNNCSSRVGGAP